LFLIQKLIFNNQNNGSLWHLTKEPLFESIPNGLTHWYLLDSQRQCSNCASFVQQIENPDAKVQKICSLVVATAAVLLAYSLESAEVA
jgi:hypothetical protein